MKGWRFEENATSHTSSNNDELQTQNITFVQSELVGKSLLLKEIMAELGC